MSIKAMNLNPKKFIYTIFIIFIVILSSKILTTIYSEKFVYSNELKLDTLDIFKDERHAKFYLLKKKN